MPQVLRSVYVKRHPVLGEFSWSNIPQVVLLTGVNGSGKTQLLDAIAKALHKPNTQKNVLGHTTIDCTVTPDKVIYVPWQHSLGASSSQSYTQLQQTVVHVQDVRRGARARGTDETLKKLLPRIEKKLGANISSKPLDYFESREFIELASHE